jgi:Transmembrane amino acid transporter protein
MIAAVTILSTVVTIFVFSLWKIADKGFNHHFNTLDLFNAGRFFGVVCFSIEGIGLMLPIRSTLKTASTFRFLFNSVSSLIISFYLLYGVACVYAYGDKLQ